MPRYNFSEISDFEFEELCRDLMQEELGLSLELFAPGRDQGIDFRHVGFKENGAYTIVGQCKRWADGSFSQLLWHLSNKELPKIRRLDPKRYVLMTSVSLSPDQKSKVVTALAPWVKSPQDIKARDDITGLLARFPEIERRHIKLWLTSSEVLDALVNSDIANRSDYVLERAQEQIRLWVPNESFNRSRQVLARDHVCVISGAPGIGKSMLAAVLLADYASRKYQPVVISEDIIEGERAWRSNLRQVFVYDDFLGLVSPGELRLRKNEESRLSLFLDRVRISENKRFILTTREYILAEALHRYERLADADLESFKNVVSLEDYTLRIRGLILYNHLFFSNLPHSLKTSLLPSKKYWAVIRHPNYNPRVIEHAVSLRNISDLSPEEFVANLFATLDDPTKIWERILNQLPKMARLVLIALASLPAEVFLDDLRAVIQRLCLTDFDRLEFGEAIRVIEGTFIDIREARPGARASERLVAIRNPSVRDYLWARLESFPDEAGMLLDGAIFFEQCMVLYVGQNHAISMPVRLSGDSGRARQVVSQEKVAARAIELIGSATPSLGRFVGGGYEYTDRVPVRLERRVAFILSVSVEHPHSQPIATAAASALSMVVDEWQRGHGSTTDALELVNQLLRTGDLLQEDTVVDVEDAVFSLITSQLSRTEDFEALVGLASLTARLFECPYRSLDSWSTEFEEFLDGERDWLLEEIDDPDWLDTEMGTIRKIANALPVDISELEMLVDDRIEGLRTVWEPDDDDPLPEIASGPRQELDEDEIDALFCSLC